MRLAEWMERERRDVPWLRRALEERVGRPLDHSHVWRIARGDSEPGLELTAAIEELTGFDVRAPDLLKESPSGLEAAPAS